MNTMLKLLSISLLLPALALSLDVEKRGSVIQNTLGTGGHLKNLANAPAPKWYRRFNIDFNETSIILFNRETEGKWWYDADEEVEVITREDGRGDRYCGSIHPRTVTPCTHLVTEGKRYLIFPELNECCLCCIAEQGCGILSPDWLEDATFEGNETINDYDVFTFSKKGIQPNMYYATATEEQLPVELDEWPNLYQNLHTETFDEGPIPPELLEVPANCLPRCPLTSLCTAVGHRRQAFRRSV